MDPQGVEEYVEISQQLVDSSPQMDEANTKAAILRDFLDLLAWEIPVNTQLEYSVKAFGQTYKVDYALILEGTPVAFLEAKGVDTALTTEHDEQLSSYMRNKDVNYGILTNGKQYRFFQRRVHASNVEVQQVGDVKLQDLPDRLTVLKAFTKDIIESGESEKILGRIHELQNARECLEENKDDIAIDLTGVLTDRVSDAISSLAESQSKEMVDRLIKDIDGEIDGDTETSSKRKATGARGVGSLASENEGGKSSGDYVIKISDSEKVIATIVGHNQAEAMINVTNYLIENHGLLDKISIPWVPSQTKAIINDKPNWEEADPNYKPLIDGHYIDIKLNKSGKQREIRRMVGKCGLGVTFEGGW